jgi:uncharacterized protein (DUF1501 family)
MNLTRRKLLLALGAGAFSLQIPRAASAATTHGGYRALVCVGLQGGNDGNNMIVPMDDRYADYAAVRGDYTANSSMLGIPKQMLVPLPGASGQAEFGLHPDLAPLRDLWDAGSLAPIFNLGTLVQPMTKADYVSNLKPRPAQLMSHPDQQRQWQTTSSLYESRTGWAGRLADALGAMNEGSRVPVFMGVSGSGLLGIGNASSPLLIPESGGFGLDKFGGNYQTAMDNALNSLAVTKNASTLAGAAQTVFSDGIAASALVSPLLTASTPIDSLFAAYGNSISRQLWQVAKVIAGRGSLSGVQREIFFVSLASFDTHNSQIDRQGSLFRQLAPALRAFHDAMTLLGTSSAVTTFTTSDFGRTLRSASGGGTDHAWGNHHLVMGGAVKGRTTYGQFPQLTLGGPDDVGSDGRWLPTTSVDQYAATLATWMGAKTSDLSTIFPSLANFGNTPLGFLA